MSDPDCRPRGAYGLTLPELPGAAELLVPAPDLWPAWRLLHRKPGSGQSRNAERLSSERAELRLQGEGWVEIDRASSTSTLFLPERPADTEMVHPFLSLTAATCARWRGWNCFHAGGLILDGGAWAILGDKGAGKSSALAWCVLESGLGVLNDDVMVVDADGNALVGPRCLDLRPDAARRFEAGEAIGVVGARERWRVPLGPMAPTAPLRGWIELVWGDEIGVRPLGPAERFAVIVRNLALRLLPPEVDGLMDLLALPAWRLTRPQRFEQLGEAANRLLFALRS